jgi:alpha-tubulin suppressor-like RCC1 family protein
MMTNMKRKTELATKVAKVSVQGVGDAPEKVSDPSREAKIKSTTLTEVPIFTFLLPLLVTAQQLQILAGMQRTCVMINGRVGCWGNGGDGALGLQSTTNFGGLAGDMAKLKPIAFAAPAHFATSITMGLELSAHTCAMLSYSVFTSGTCFGFNQFNECGVVDPTPSPFALLDPPSLIPAFNLESFSVNQTISLQKATCVLSAGGAISCWGDAQNGLLGRDGLPDVTSLVSAQPIIFNTQFFAVQISGGHRHACAVFSNERARCWGANNVGQLG